MRKKILSLIFMATVLVTSQIPAHAADVQFLSDEETFVDSDFEPENLFNDTSPSIEDSKNEDIPQCASYYNELNSPVNIKFIKKPLRSEYFYGMSLSDINFTGTVIEVTYVNGKTENLTFGYSDSVMDSYGNQYIIGVDYVDSWSEPLPVGEYQIYIWSDSLTCGGATLKIKDLADMPVIDISSKQKCQTTIRLTTPETFCKLIPDTNGECRFEISTIDKDIASIVVYEVYDGHLQEIYSTPDLSANSFNVRSGEIYYIEFISGKAASIESGITMEITTELVSIDSVRVVKEPLTNTVYDMDEMLPGLGLEVAYSNGIKSIIYPGTSKDTTYYGHYADCTFDGKYGSELPAGIYDLTYTIDDFDLVFPDVHLKKFGDFPKIKERGIITSNAVTASGDTWIKFTTGKYDRYIITNSKDKEMSIVQGNSKFPNIKSGKVTFKMTPNTTYYIACNGDGNPLNITDVTFKIEPYKKKNDIAKCKIKLSGTSFYYSGRNIYPKIIIEDQSQTRLKEGRDYTIAYSNNKYPGTAKITIKGRGENFTGTITKTFNIALRAPKLRTTASEKRGSLKITWDKVSGATGYAIYAKTTKGWKYLGSTKYNFFVHSASNKAIPAQSRRSYTYTVKAFNKSSSRTVYSKYSRTGITGKVK